MSSLQLNAADFLGADFRRRCILGSDVDVDLVPPAADGRRGGTRSLPPAGLPPAVTGLGPRAVHPDREAAGWRPGSGG